ncbi:MAG: hypothetical protein OXE87_08460 [Chloroflexi bacterium]|nr:hypothetical protein [Chloroflexota bacterium]
MIKVHGSFLDMRFGRTGRTGAAALLCLLGIIGMAIVSAELAVPRDEVSAAPAAVGYEPWLEINCLRSVVDEGDDFCLIVNKKLHSEWPHETMKLWWYTHPITADATDYEHLHQQRIPVGTRPHGLHHTLEDNYPEDDETFIVEFLSAVSKGHDGRCEITITDDDGVGIYDLEITSHFTGDVTTVNPDTGEQAGYAGIFLRDYGDDTLVFGY